MHAFIEEEGIMSNLSSLIRPEDYPVPSDEVLREKVYSTYNIRKSRKMIMNVSIPTSMLHIWRKESTDVVTGEPLFKFGRQI